MIPTQNQLDDSDQNVLIVRQQTVHNRDISQLSRSYTNVKVDQIQCLGSDDSPGLIEIDSKRTGSPNDTESKITKSALKKPNLMQLQYKNCMLPNKNDPVEGWSRKSSTQEQNHFQIKFKVTQTSDLGRQKTQTIKEHRTESEEATPRRFSHQIVIDPISKSSKKDDNDEGDSFSTDKSMEKFDDEEVVDHHMQQDNLEVPEARRRTFWNPMGGAQQMQGLRKMLTPTSAGLEKQDTKKEGKKAGFWQGKLDLGQINLFDTKTKMERQKTKTNIENHQRQTQDLLKRVRTTSKLSEIRAADSPESPSSKLHENVSSDKDVQQIQLIEDVVQRKMQPVVNAMGDMLQNHDKILFEVYLTMQKIIEKYQEQLNQFDRNKIGYNFVFMFASPAYMEHSTRFGPQRSAFARLQNKEEYKLIKESVNDAKIELTVHKVHATHINFENKVLEEIRPGAIHFSGHGVTAQEIRTENIKMQMEEDEVERIFKKGDALVMENQSCLAEYLYADDLRTMTENASVELDFVFMATCHSEFAADIFKNAGAKHVVGINKDEKIMDEAILTFTQTFYAKLWKQGSKICQCFESAKFAVQRIHGDEQSSKFVKFTNHEYKKCVLYGNFQVGKPSFKKEKAMLWDLPPPVSKFIGYKEIGQQLINNFFRSDADQRFVRLTGWAGVGKSALARHAIHFVQERNFIEGGCIYVNGRSIDDFQSFLEKLVNWIDEDSSGWFKIGQKRNNVGKHYEGDSSRTFNRMSTHSYHEKSREEFFFGNLLKQMKQSGEYFLFFFDNVDELVKNEDIKTSRSFFKFIERILEECGSAKVLITCRDSYLPSQLEFSYNLKGLEEQKDESWELFDQHCKEVTRAEKTQLVQKLPDKNKFKKPWTDITTGKPLRKLNYTIGRLGEHHFFDLLGRNPQAIILTALLRKSNPNLTMAGIYQNLQNEALKLSQDKSDKNAIRQEMTDALEVTLTVQVEELRTWDKPAYKFMQLLSFLPTFNYVSDLLNYWSELKTKLPLPPIIDNLLQKGLIRIEETQLRRSEKCIQLAQSVRAYLGCLLQDRPDRKDIDLMLFKNYRDKMKCFYLKYKNMAAIDIETTINGDEDIDMSLNNIEISLQQNDENLFQTALRCINQWQQGRTQEDIRRQSLDYHSNIIQAPNIDEKADSSPTRKSLLSGPAFTYTNKFSEIMTQKMGLKLATEFEIKFHGDKGKTSEQFFLYLLSNMILVERYDFLDLLLEKLGHNIDEEPDSINGLPCSYNFLGNFWRLSAICYLKEARKKTHSGLTVRELEKTQKRLKHAIKNFEAGDDEWGLGLSHNLLGRVYTFKANYDFDKAQSHYKKAVDHFKKIDHYRGTYVTIHDLWFLQREHQTQVLSKQTATRPWPFINDLDSESEGEQITPKNYVEDTTGEHQKYVMMYQKMKQTAPEKKYGTKVALLYAIVCSDRQGFDTDIHVTLDLEISLNRMKKIKSIGKLLSKTQSGMNSIKEDTTQNMLRVPRANTTNRDMFRRARRCQTTELGDLQPNSQSRSSEFDSFISVSQASVQKPQIMEETLENTVKTINEEEQIKKSKSSIGTLTPPIPSKIISIKAEKNNPPKTITSISSAKTSKSVTPKLKIQPVMINIKENNFDASEEAPLSSEEKMQFTQAQMQQDKDQDKKQELVEMAQKVRAQNTEAQLSKNLLAQSDQELQVNLKVPKLSQTQDLRLQIEDPKILTATDNNLHSFTGDYRLNLMPSTMKESQSAVTVKTILPPTQFIKKLRKHHDMIISQPPQIQQLEGTYTKPHGVKLDQCRPYRISTKNGFQNSPKKLRKKKVKERKLSNCSQDYSPRLEIDDYEYSVMNSPKTEFNTTGILSSGAKKRRYQDITKELKKEKLHQAYKSQGPLIKPSSPRTNKRATSAVIYHDREEKPTYDKIIQVANSFVNTRHRRLPNPANHRQITRIVQSPASPMVTGNNQGSGTVQQNNYNIFLALPEGKDAGELLETPKSEQVLRPFSSPSKSAKGKRLHLKRPPSQAQSKQLNYLF